MAIRITSICDKCGKECNKQTILPEDAKTLQEVMGLDQEMVAFECSDCILEEVRAEETTTSEKPESPQ